MNAAAIFDDLSTLADATRSAVQQAGITLDQIKGAGFGVSGLDYPAQKAPTLQAIDVLGLWAPLEAVNGGQYAANADLFGVGVQYKF